MTQDIFQECIETIRELAGNEYLYFDTAIEIKTTPHSFPFRAWGVCTSPDGRLYIMDSNQEWHEADPAIGNTPLVIGSLYQRLQLMRRRYAKAS
ncbi:hypothetical protein V9K67_08475 [Paraflavisolibacter sp. H34]|uniref:hypothetical protein n=1 Tax=Huijunlia imazamoxiresistens TaxID=3127457 RepID=UPI003016EF60